MSESLTNTVRPAQRSRLRRGVALLPSVLTVANLLCGYYAVLAVFRGAQGDLDRAAKAIGLAMLFDAFDGFVARLTGSSSEFGKQFDSIADVISFGVAPAFLAFAWGVRGVDGSQPLVSRHIAQIGWVVTFAFVLCCAGRLARFNIQGMAPGSGMRYFVGLPTPAAAGMVAATIHAFKDPLKVWPLSLVWLTVVGALAGLMISTVRYYSFKDMGWTKRRPMRAVLLVALLIAAVFVYSEEALLLMASAYVASGIVAWLARHLRRRSASSTASSD